MSTNKLRGLRVENGLTQEELAEIIGLSLSTYQRIESGERKITLSEAYQISQLFGKKIDDIFLFKNIPKGIGEI